jgi:hypothetical protein
MRELLPTLIVLALAACQASSAPQNSPAPVPTGAQGGGPLPPRWVGVGFERGRIAVSVTEVGEKPRRDALEPPVPGRRPGSIEVTDVAYDTRRERIYVGTCCEPGSGSLRRIEWQSAPAFQSDDQGFAVDVAGEPATVARTDTFGTLGIQAAGGEQEVRPDAGVADVAVGASAGGRVVALVDSRRLRALVPTVSWHEPALWVWEPKPAGAWTETRHPLPPDLTFCRVLALRNGAIGLLAGGFDPANPLECTGEQLDIFDGSHGRLQQRVLTFPARVRHLSVDESSGFLIFTTVDGAVGWQTLDGRGGDLASEGFLAADW